MSLQGGMSSDFASLKIDVEPYRYSSSWLIGASTHAIDRFVADVERIYQPPAEHAGGRIEFSLTNKPVVAFAKKRSSRKLRLLNRLRPPPLIDLGDVTFFDIREDDYFNWSHQVNFFLTLALGARSAADVSVVIVMSQGMPQQAADLYGQFGFEILSTDGPVRGRQLHWSVSHRQVVPSARRQLIAEFMREHDSDPVAFPTFELPRKVFLARRGSRSLSNEREVETVLSDHGFVKVYAEGLTVPQQFALFRQATDVVGIHGAGLAPMQYRSPSAPPLIFVELAPAGIVTRWFGIMCEQVGGHYIAVRVRIKPEYVEGLYADEPFLSYCNDRFEVDPRSVDVALEMIASQAGRGPTWRMPSP